MTKDVVLRPKGIHITLRSDETNGKKGNEPVPEGLTLDLGR